MKLHTFFPRFSSQRLPNTLIKLMNSNAIQINIRETLPSDIEYRFERQMFFCIFLKNCHFGWKAAKKPANLQSLIIAAERILPNLVKYTHIDKRDIVILFLSLFFFCYCLQRTSLHVESKCGRSLWHQKQNRTTFHHNEACRKMHEYILG